MHFVIKGHEVTYADGMLKCQGIEVPIDRHFVGGRCRYTKFGDAIADLLEKLPTDNMKFKVDDDMGGTLEIDPNDVLRDPGHFNTGVATLIQKNKDALFNELVPYVKRARVRIENLQKSMRNRDITCIRPKGLDTLGLGPLSTDKVLRYHEHYPEYLAMTENHGYTIGAQVRLSGTLVSDDVTIPSGWVGEVVSTSEVEFKFGAARVVVRVPKDLL